MDGWQKILQRIEDDPSRSQILKDRYMSLVGELTSIEDKYYKMLQLAETLISIDPNQAMDIADTAYQLERGKPNALELIFNILQIQGKYDQAQIVREQLQSMIGIPLTAGEEEHTQMAMVPGFSDEGFGHTTVNFSSGEGNASNNLAFGDDEEVTSVAPLVSGESLAEHLCSDEDEDYLVSHHEQDEGNIEDAGGSSLDRQNKSQFATGIPEFSLGNMLSEPSVYNPPESEKQFFPEGDGFPTIATKVLEGTNDKIENSNFSTEEKTSIPENNMSVTIELTGARLAEPQESEESREEVKESLRDNNDDSKLAQVEVSKRKSLFKEILSKQLESFASKICFVSKDRLELQYHDDWTKTELSILLDSLRDCHPEILDEFIMDNWGYTPDKHGIVILQSLDLVEKSPQFWGVFLDCLIVIGFSRKALFEIRTIVNEKDDIEWANVAWKRLDRIYDQLEFAKIKWVKSDGVEKLRERLNKRPKISYSVLFSPRSHQNRKII